MSAGDGPSEDAGHRVTASGGSSAVVAGRDVYLGEWTRQVLGELNAHTEARQLAAMPHNEAARLLARSPTTAAAAVVQALLSADRGLAISLLGTIGRDIAEKLIASAGPAFLKQLPVAAEAINNSAAEAGKLLGEETGGLAVAAKSKRRTEGYYRRYAHGIVHWSERGGAHATTGAAAAYYVSHGGSGGRLGFPLSPERKAGPSQPFGTIGTWQLFEWPSDYSPDICGRLGTRCGATLYWSDKHGSYRTWGDIGEYYESFGGTPGELGFPRGDVAEVEGPARRPDGSRTTGLRQEFEGGTVFYSDKTGVIQLSPAVASYYHSRGERGGDLGFPVSLETDVESPYGTTGKCQRFEWIEDHPADVLRLSADWIVPGGAVVYRSQAVGIHAVTGGIGKLHERLHAAGKGLGFPKSDTIKVSSSSGIGIAQEFEGGVIFWTKAYRSAAVRADIMGLFHGHDDLLRQVGFPVAGESTLTDEKTVRVQCFENGVVTVRGGTAEAWVRPQAGLSVGDCHDKAAIYPA
jgi:hypothetical protein